MTDCPENVIEGPGLRVLTALLKQEQPVTLAALTEIDSDPRQQTYFAEAWRALSEKGHLSKPDTRERVGALMVHFKDAGLSAFQLQRIEALLQEHRGQRGYLKPTGETWPLDDSPCLHQPERDVHTFWSIASYPQDGGAA